MLVAILVAGCTDDGANSCEAPAPMPLPAYESTPDAVITSEQAWFEIESYLEGAESYIACVRDDADVIERCGQPPRNLSEVASVEPVISGGRASFTESQWTGISAYSTSYAVWIACADGAPP